MESEVKSVVAYTRLQYAEQRTNPKTGEVTDIRESGFLYLIAIENGLPVVKEVKCSIAAAKQMEASSKKFLAAVAPLAEDLPLDNREYKLDNGRQGFTLTLVEEGAQRKQRGSFSFEDAVFEESKQVPAPRPLPNGQSPQPVGAR